MNKVFFAVAGGTMIAASAGWASDLPLKAPAAVVEPLAASWTLNTTSELKYYTWRDSLTIPGTGTKGSELYTPVSAQMNGTVGNVLSIELVGRGGWVNINQRADDFSAGLNTVTDTNLSANFTYIGLNGFQPFAGLQTSLPTGRSSRNTQLDPDLVEVPATGLGLDIGGTVGFNLLPSTGWVLTTSATYLERGSFGRENGPVPLINPAILPPAASISIKPGDVVTLAQSISYGTGPFSARLSGSAAMEGPTFQDGLKLMKPGNTYSLSGETNYIWPRLVGTTTLLGSVTHTDAVETALATNPAIAATLANTASNVYSVGLQHLVPIGTFVVGPTASYLFRDNSGFNSSKLEFTPTKQRYSAGLLARYTASPKLTLTARVEGVWTHLDGNLPTDSMRFTAIGGAFIPVPGSPAINGAALWTTLGLNYKL